MGADRKLFELGAHLHAAFRRPARSGVELALARIHEERRVRCVETICVRLPSLSCL